MMYRINNVSDIGSVIRAVRKESGVRQDDVAGSVGVSHVYLRDLEHGKETAQIGRALKVMAELGIRMQLEIPDGAYARLESAMSSLDPNLKPAIATHCRSRSSSVTVRPKTKPPTSTDEGK